MDNLSVHKAAGVAEAIKGIGAGAVFTAYSPDPLSAPRLKPIQRMVAKLKALLRKAKERTAEDQWDRIGKPLNEFSRAECAAT